MKATTPRILLVAALAGGLGLLASVWFNGNPLWRTSTGERALHAAVNATAPTPPAGVTPAGIGDPMPAIALPGLDGKIVDLAATYPGRRLLINVWASWCGPCIEEMPELERFAAAQGTDGVQVIGLALDTPDGVRDFLSRVPVRYPIVLDTPGPADASVWLGNAKGVLPYTVLVDADGRIARQKVGPFKQGEISGWVD
jgi:thiol-disulfide isomerase/thioredoxin